MLAGLLLAFASGATALVYEVLWTRQFMYLFGATAPAISATLSAIFFGFAAGNAFIGSRTARWPRALRAYGMLEIGIGLAALLVVPLLGVYEHIYPALHGRFFAHPTVFLVVKVCLAAAALFVPAFLMGGTLPLLAQAFVSSPGELGEVGGGVYAANTFGATVGALSVPFFLLPTYGASRSYYAAAALNVLIGAAAVWLGGRSENLSVEAGRGARAGGRKEKSGPEKSGPAKSWRGVPAWMLNTMAFASGALVLALEVLWARMLAQVHENSIYSFAIVLAVFLVGLAGGAALARALMRRRRDPRTVLGFAWVFAGVLVFGSPPLFHFLTGGLRYAGEPGAGANLSTLVYAAATMLVPTILAGMILPLLMELTGAVRVGAPGELLGRLLGVNTAGAVAGPLLATYVVLPGLGLWAGIAAVAVVMVAAGEVALGGVGSRRPALVRRFALAGLLAALVIGANPFTLPRVRIEREGGERLLHLDEGSHGIVAVVESPEDRWMLLNNFYTLGGTASANEERQQARIPLLLHPSPRRVAFLGLGTGITAGGALAPSVEKVVALELVPEVVDAAGEHFADANLGLLRDGRVEVIKEDARVYLKGGGQEFDVIVGDLVVPWRSGESALFTKEHFETARRALAPGGVFCQWLPTFQLSEEQFRIVAATFLDVFPRATLWRGDFLPDAPALALVGHTDVQPLDAAALDERVERLKHWCAPTTPLLCARGGPWLFLVGPLDPADPQFATARRNRESEPWVELLSPAARPQSGTASPQRFTGEALYGFMERIRARPVGGSPLANLGREHLAWRDAGAGLWGAALLLQAGREEEANRRAAESLSSLPSELREVIAGGTSGRSR
jgi:spermidine synthase